MLARWPIRNKLLIGLALLLVMVGVLSYSGFHGLYSYRSMIRSLSERVAELPRAAELGQTVSDARVALRDLRAVDPVHRTLGTRFASEEFAYAVEKVQAALAVYRKQLASNDEDGNRIRDGSREWKTVYRIEEVIAKILQLNREGDWVVPGADFNELRDELDELQHLTVELPSYLHRRIVDLKDEVRDQYRVLITISWVATVVAALLLLLFTTLFYAWVFRPLRILIKGSRKVAAGNFNHHIRLDTKDEMAELATTVNAMTTRFRDIRDDLDRQVSERTKQALMSEKLASVGFLAAGVSHEINNPLAAIAVCAESLESRLTDAMADNPEREVVLKYLQMIQTEAFRCKGITEKLLDFSRMGDRRRESEDLRYLVQEMIDLLAHHGKYKDKHLSLAPGESLIAPVNSQEIKQVVLNLLVNALDCVEPGGSVRVSITQQGEYASLAFVDDGCGMTQEVLQHLFEPFFTRRKNGQGTGLGLAISHRIVTDHAGRIEASSAGPGQGSRFEILLPVAKEILSEESYYARRQAA